MVCFLFQTTLWTECLKLRISKVVKEADFSQQLTWGPAYHGQEKWKIKEIAVQLKQVDYSNCVDTLPKAKLR